MIRVPLSHNLYLSTMGEGDMPAVDAFASISFDIGVAKTVLVMAMVAVLCGLFLTITFLQSGLNKIVDYTGNKSYFASQFEKSFMKNFVGFLLPIVLILELGSAFCILVGVVLLFMEKPTDILGFGLMLSAFTLICLLTGQRIAKDYAGAASLSGYFLVAIAGLIGYAFCF